MAKNNFLTAIVNFFKTGLWDMQSPVSLDERENMWLFVGLGNHGEKYKNHRHNVGYMVADAMHEHYNFDPFRSKFQGKLAEGRVGVQKIVLLKPETYMNNSGQSVVKTAQFYKIPPERIVAFHDELDIKPNAVRTKLGGGNAGHNGLKSMQAHLGTPDFWRVRIGIGRPEHKDEVSDYVLSDFAKAEGSWVKPLVELLAKAAELIVTEDMKRYEAHIQNYLKESKNGI